MCRIITTFKLIQKVSEKLLWACTRMTVRCIDIVYSSNPWLISWISTETMQFTDKNWCLVLSVVMSAQKLLWSRMYDLMMNVIRVSSVRRLTDMGHSTRKYQSNQRCKMRSITQLQLHTFPRTYASHWAHVSIEHSRSLSQLTAWLLCKPLSKAQAVTFKDQRRLYNW